MCNQKRVDAHMEHQKSLKGYPIFKQYRDLLVRRRVLKVEDVDVLLMLADCMAADVDNELIGILVRLVATKNDTLWDAYVMYCKG